MQRIFREILSAAEALEVPLTVAYLGPQGTYTEEASYKHFGRSMLSMPMQSIPDVFAAVENGAANFGVVPIENSTEGPINQTLDVLMESQLRICGEVVLRIHHQLMSHCTSLPDIKSVHAHPQSFAQCRGWLDANLPQAERITESSNAAAAQFAQSNPECAAIAGSSAAELYCLPILASKIEDLKTNTTRFVVIGDQAVAASGDDSTSILMSAPHKPGGLRSLLKPFEDQGISMTRIESRPMRNALWEYVFYIDVKGHQNDPKLALVLPQLKEMTAIMRVLGSYPSAL